MFEKLEYKELRKEIHKIFYTFEIECHKDKEFDFECLEARTDEILKLIQRQGGTV